jgi:hypothetical protein
MRTTCMGAFAISAFSITTGRMIAVSCSSAIAIPLEPNKVAKSTTSLDKASAARKAQKSSMSCAISSVELVNLSARPKQLLIADERAATRAPSFP